MPNAKTRSLNTLPIRFTHATRLAPAFVIICALVLTGLAGGPARAQPLVPVPSLEAVPALAGSEAPAAGKTIRTVVARVYDGDTFEFRHEARAYRVRLSGVDAPERSQAFADLSRKALKAMISDKEVRIDILKTDVYKRFVGKVWVESGGELRDVAAQMLDQGLAWHFKRYQRDQSPEDRLDYARIEDRAKALRRGLWQDDAPLAPWLFRDQQKGMRLRAY